MGGREVNEYADADPLGIEKDDCTERLYLAERYAELRETNLTLARHAATPVARRDWRWRPARDAGV